MAGPFGFEADKYEVSQAVANRVLLPAVNAAAPRTLIITDGFSCREQIHQSTPYTALHTAYATALAACDPAQRNKPAVVTKNTARAALKTGASAGRRATRRRCPTG